MRLFIDLGIWVVLVGVLFIVQFISTTHLQGFFFFPAIMFYFATFMPLPQAIILGCVSGSILDGFSPLPFGYYTLGIGGGMTLACFGMRLVDERHIIAHGIVSFLTIGIYAVAGSIYYIVAGSSAIGIKLFFYDIAVFILILISLIVGHIIIKKIR